MSLNILFCFFWRHPLSENETQDHIYECKEILKQKNFKQSEIPKYQEIFNGNVHKKVIVARIFKENLEIRDLKPSWRKKNENELATFIFLFGPGDRYRYLVCSWV